MEAEHTQVLRRQMSTQIRQQHQETSEPTDQENPTMSKPFQCYQCNYEAEANNIKELHFLLLLSYFLGSYQHFAECFCCCLLDLLNLSVLMLLTIL